ncbi:MAG: hypothetical protein F6J93_35155 [Oscillatoria sp. SIO1A7]|nr:hypothetical protein [Oscillatoria sp. SIO1A7]
MYPQALGILENCLTLKNGACSLLEADLGCDILVAILVAARVEIKEVTPPFVRYHPLESPVLSPGRWRYEFEKLALGAVFLPDNWRAVLRQSALERQGGRV